MSAIKCSLNLLIWLAIFLPAHSETKENDYDWESLVFTMQWPLTACLAWKDERPTHKCILPEQQKWTIHGVWPNSKDGPLGPFFCNTTWVFNPDGVESIRQELIQMWPNIHGEDTEDSLWKHEWEKHGTCAALDSHFSSELLYFNQGLQWANEYQMTHLLSENNIVPSLTTQYNATVISEIVREATGVIPKIACESDRETGLTYLAEIRVCFSRDLRLIDCEEHRNGEKRLPPLLSVGDCPTHKLITYPSDASSESVQWLKKNYGLKRKLDKQEKLERLRNKSFRLLH